jgi:hypothetical protein
MIFQFVENETYPEGNDPLNSLFEMYNVCKVDIDFHSVGSEP